MLLKKLFLKIQDINKKFYLYCNKLMNIFNFRINRDFKNFDKDFEIINNENQNLNCLTWELLIIVIIMIILYGIIYPLLKIIDFEILYQNSTIIIPLIILHDGMYYYFLNLNKVLNHWQKKIYYFIDFLIGLILFYYEINLKYMELLKLKLNDNLNIYSSIMGIGLLLLIIVYNKLSLLSPKNNYLYTNYTEYELQKSEEFYTNLALVFSVLLSFAICLYFNLDLDNYFIIIGLIVYIPILLIVDEFTNKKKKKKVKNKKIR